MGLPERLVDRQLARISGGRSDKMQSLRTLQSMLIASASLGLFTSVLSIVSGLFDRRLWVGLGVLWLFLGYVAVRQKIYLRRLDT